MDIFVEITGSLARRLTVAVPAIEIKSAIQKRVQKLTKTAKLDGFRPGKIPAKVIEQRFGDAIRGEAIEEVLQSSLSTALQQENLHPAESPTIQSLEADEGQPLKYSATFEVLPEIHIKNLTDVTLEKMVVNIEDGDLNRVLEQMRKQHVEWEEVTRPAQMGDRLTVDFIRIVDGEPQQETEQKNVTLILDEGNIPAGFEKLMGAKAGDEVIIDLPEQVEAGKIKNQASIKVNKIEAPKLPAIDNELAKKLGVETVEELRTQVLDHMRRELDNVLKNKLKTQLIDKLIEMHSIELPKALIERERQHLEKEWLERMRQNTHNANLTLPPEAKQRSLEMAQRRVTLSLLFAEIIKQHKIEVDKNRVHEQIVRIAGSFQEPQAIINMIHKQPEILNGIRSQVMEEQVVEKLLEQVKYTEKTAQYSDVMQFGSNMANEEDEDDEGDAGGHGHHHEHVHGEHCNHEHDGHSA